MRLIFVLPAVVVPVSVVAAVLVCRQLAVAADALRVEVDAARRLLDDIGETRHALRSVELGRREGAAAAR